MAINISRLGWDPSKHLLFKQKHSLQLVCAWGIYTITVEIQLLRLGRGYQCILHALSPKNSGLIHCHWKCGLPSYYTIALISHAQTSCIECFSSVSNCLLGPQPTRHILKGITTQKMYTDIVIYFLNISTSCYICFYNFQQPFICY